MGPTFLPSSTGASGEAHGYGDYADAVNAAVDACGAGCTMMNWEENECIALSTGNGRWGEAHGYDTSDDAVAAANAECGAGCSWVEWACD